MSTSAGQIVLSLSPNCLLFSTRCCTAVGFPQHVSGFLIATAICNMFFQMKRGLFMISVLSSKFGRIIFAAALCVLSSAAQAGVLSYTPGVGGTFDASTPSTFTFTTFGPGSLSDNASYNAAKIIAKWGGAASLPAGGITATAVSASNPTIPFGTFTIPAGTAAGALYIPPTFTSFTPNLSKPITALTLTMTLPSMNVPDGFFVDFALLLTDGALNLNATDFQRVTAASQVAVPEPGVGLLGAVLAGAAFVVQRRRRRNAAV